MAKNILILGFGGMGCRVVSAVAQKICRIGKSNDTRITSIVFDTDVAVLSSLPLRGDFRVIPLSSHARVGQIKSRLGEAVWGNFFPADPMHDMHAPDLGTQQWRKLGYLTMLDFLADEKRKRVLDEALTGLDLAEKDSHVQIYAVSSLAGGTGAGIFIPMTLYIKKRLGELAPTATVTGHVMLALPEIYATVLEDNGSAYLLSRANAYAALRELNAIQYFAYGQHPADEKTKDAENTPEPFRIGNPSSPAGVLFDSADPAYHGFDKIPFHSVSLMGKMVGVNSIAAHEAEMVSVLYTLVATQAGEGITSTLPWQGRRFAVAGAQHAAYTSFAAAEIEHPVEETVQYFAWRKTRDDIAALYGSLYLATMQEIAREKEHPLHPNKNYGSTSAEYAECFLKAKEQSYAHDPRLYEIFNAATVRCEKQEYREISISVLEEYWQQLKGEICRNLPELGRYEECLSKHICDIKNPGLFAGKYDRQFCAMNVRGNAQEGYSVLNDFYREAVLRVRDWRFLLADAILPMDIKKDPCNALKLSFVENVLKRDGRYIHPVAALGQLCHFRRLIAQELETLRNESSCSRVPWEAVNAYEIGTLPLDFLRCTEDIEVLGLGKKARKSAYLQTDAKRLANMLDDGRVRPYIEARTDYEVDNQALRRDCQMILTHLYRDAEGTLLHEVLTQILARTDTLIEIYRDCFHRLHAEKTQLDKRVAVTETLKSGDTDSISVYIGACAEHRRACYEEMMSLTAFDAVTTGSTVGYTLFNAAYQIACRKTRGEEREEKAIDPVFIIQTIYQENYNQIAGTSYCRDLGAQSVIEVIAEANRGKEREALTSVLDVCRKLAAPSIDVDPHSCALYNGFWIIDSAEEAYLNDNRELFAIPNDYTFDLAAALVGEASGTNVKRVAVEKTATPNIARYLLVTLGVSPWEVKALNEQSDDGYYKDYLSAIHRAQTENDVGWDPHLGNGWHKKGVLPFINPVVEVNATSSDGKVDALVDAAKGETDT